MAEDNQNQEFTSQGIQDALSKILEVVEPSDPNDEIAIHVSDGHAFHTPEHRELTELENHKREKDLTKFLQLLSQVDTTHPKTQVKLMAKANRIIGKAPGVRGLPINDAKAVTHAVLAAVSKTGLKGLQNVIEHTISHRKKHKGLKAHVTAVFEGPMPQIEINPKAIEKAKEFIHSDGLSSQLDATGGKETYAEGGKVKAHQPLVNDHFAMHYPGLAMMTTAAKTRAHGYLNSLKPQPKSGLPFDMNKDQSLADSQYHRAVHMAVRPLSILNEIKAGTVSPSDFKHFTALHPELYELLKKELTSKITEMQLQGKKPDAKTRQGLSLFMGVPLESNLNPAAIQAVQATFKPKTPPPQQGQPADKAKKGTGSLSKFSKDYRTADQARAERANKS